MRPGFEALYRGPVIGRMNAVAPVAGLSAVVPLVIGRASRERPSALHGGSMAVAVVGVVLAARRLGKTHLPIGQMMTDRLTRGGRRARRRP